MAQRSTSTSWWTPGRAITALGIDILNLFDARDADLATQSKYGVKYLNFWGDPEGGKAFCLVEAPNKEAAIAVHREAHGLVADEIIEVKEGS